ncbi:hypothetical protein GALMADRAFT_249441 [Galerina marginata CBS 339.88]|uniref:DNA repair and recombination protein RAD54B n=1 Tax=Galerina marginata (strain CBS 339.88) TaxID=685588 RepID=A0A067T8S9_GALM3|nr:hypothetical protein GALMADRAFT_249441 [Galerina marginata CBS 339.88]
MPAFQPPIPSASLKRKCESQDEEGFSRKRAPKGIPPFEGTAPTGAIIDKYQEQVWMVQWRNPQYKKHKTWDGDGVLVISCNGEAVLYDSDGKILSTSNSKAILPLYEGKDFSVGSKEIELERAIPRVSFISGTCFGRSSNVDVSTLPVLSSSNSNSIKKFFSPSLNSDGKSKKITNDVFHLNSESRICASLENNATMTKQSLHWAANWRKPQEKKNKTWDGDAYVSLVKDKLYMISEDGKIMGSAPWKGQSLHSGYKTFIGGKEVELDLAVSASQLPAIKGSEINISQDEELPESPATVPLVEANQNQKFVAPTSFYGTTKPKSKQPLHDPDAPDNLVMKYPTKEHIKRFNKRNLPIVHVVLDPILSGKMRSHQKEGVMFLYECVMGLRKHEGQGCILADEMGLGKTLQTIALVWTLLKQNPYAGPLAVVQKVLIVCPVSLVNNWKAEFYKWLGKDRVGIMTCDKVNGNIDLFGRSKFHQVLIIGYERLRTVIDKIANIHPPIGLIICDEGHRLKSASNKTTAMFKTLDTRRRIILSGTPIQNDLGEFHAMADFCNPGLLDDYSVFRKVYETPILKSRAPDASAKEIEIGEARTAQLLSIAKSFVLRRDATLLKNHLPPKSEYVVFIVPTRLQLAMFCKILHPKKLDVLIQSSTAESLALINILTKISNSPILLKATADSVKVKKDDNTPTIQKAAVTEALTLLPDKAHIADLTLSGKLVFLSKILKLLRQNTSEKCVLVSHYTSTLNILEAYCKKATYSYYRLDGQTPQNKRQEYVNAFNKETQHSSFIFLLSSKAGGVGINLIGASRLFIIDSDWNPSHDLQSMARCHRDGQKRPVYIYRMLSTGAIDEKIYQRQVTKLALSETLIGSGASNSKSDSFTRKDLRDIFSIHPDTACNTHDLLECGCERDTPTEDFDTTSIINDDEDPKRNMGFVSASDVREEDLDAIETAYLQKKKAGLAALSEWNHINCLESVLDVHIQDNILRKIVASFAQSPTVLSGGEGERSRLDTLLAGVDIERIQAMDNLRSIRDVPGGTVSFLFERCAKSNLDAADK